MINSAARDARRHSTGQAKPDGGDLRTPAQKDRDRLLYASSFRRLAQVTQVVSADVGHVFHNRLTHSLQVAQVGRRLAERLVAQHRDELPASAGLDPDVVEAACYAHDLGHPPFGHTAETELNLLAGEAIDGFEGNAQSFRIVTKLAQNSPLHRGLDLTRATLAAVLKYPWYRGENAAKKNKWGAYRTEREDFEFARKLDAEPYQPSLEASLMDWADDITYSVHDLDDFFRAGRIPLHLLADRRYSQERDAFFEAAFARHEHDSGLWKDPASLKESFNQVIVGLFPLDRPYEGTWDERAAMRQFSSQLIGRFVGLSRLITKDGRCALHVEGHVHREVAMLKELTWVYVIDAPSLVSQQFGQREVIRRLFEVYVNASLKTEDLKLFPPYYRQSIEEAGADDKLMKRTVVDFIAGMTEAQALAMCNRLSGVSVGSGLDEIVR